MMRRLVLAGLFILAFIAVQQPVWAGTDAPSSPREPWQVVASTATTLTVDVSPREGADPTTALLVIPPTGHPSVEVLSLEKDVRLTGELRAEALASGQHAVVRLEPIGALRSVRLARLSVWPFSVEGKTSVYRVRHVRLRIRFPAVPDRKPAPIEPAVDRLIRQVVLNADYPAAWRLPRTAVDTSDIPDNPPARRADALRLRISGSGIYVIRRDMVAAAGWDVSAVDPRYVHLWFNGQDVPVWFTGQKDGRWDEGDEIRFYVPPFRSPYTDEQVWWLTVESTPGPRWLAKRSDPPTEQPIRVVPATEVTERDRLYDSNATDAHGEHWFWYDLKFADFPPYAPLDFPFYVYKPAPVAQARVQLRLYAYKGARHDFTFKINGVPAGELHGSWQGRRDVYFSLPDGTLKDGQNILTIQSADRGQYPDGVYVDGIGVTYRRTLEVPGGNITFSGQEGDATYQITALPPEYTLVADVTHPLSPTLIYQTPTWMWSEAPITQALAFRTTGASHPLYHVQSRSTWGVPIVEANIPSNLHTPDEGADIIVIAPRAWHDALTPWVQWRTQQGHRVKVVALQDIYDEFSYGQVDPEAIRQFLRQAYTTWPDPAPRYALLVGDGSYDFKDNLGFHPDNILPPYLANVDPWLGETAADIRYGEVTGDDNIPDIIVGRWPVGNREELETVIRKTLTYERDTAPASWQRRIVFVADNYFSPRGVPDSAGDFAAQAEYTLENQLPPPYLRERLYFMPWDGAGHNGISNIDEMKSKIVLTWNQGAGIINWVGHASYEQWGEENFLHARQLSGLRNEHRLPFLFSITCFTGYFHHPEYPSLDEALLVKPDGGTVASWSPTGLAVAYGHQYLQQGFYAALADGERNVGRLTLAGHLFLLAHAAQYSFLPQTYVIIGDPTLSLKLGPVAHAQFMPHLVREAH